MNANGFFSQAAAARSSLGSAASDIQRYIESDAPVRSMSFDPETIRGEAFRPIETKTVEITKFVPTVPAWAWVAGGLLGVGLAVMLFKGKR